MKRNLSNLPAFLGMDCGGTRSVAIYEFNGTRRRLEAGPGNVALLDDAQLIALLRDLGRVQGHDPRPSSIAIGMAGAGGEPQRKRIRQAAEKLWRNIPCLAIGDLETALAAAELGEQAGQNRLAAVVVVLSGTGSVFYGRNSRDERVRIGGWGHIVGDKGSAYEIGLRALKAALYYYDRDGKVPGLGQRLLQTLLLNELREIPAWALNAPKTEIARLAREVSAAAMDGDRIARDILKAAAQSLGRDAVACAARLAKRGQRVKFVFTGGVLLNQPRFQREVAGIIRRDWRGAEVVPLNNEPALGAVELARQAWQESGAPLPDSKQLTSGSGPATAKPHWTSTIDLRSSPTEQRNPRSMTLDRLPLQKAIALMMREDERIPAAILAERKHIERAVRFIIASFRRKGRLFYVGAGTSGRLGVLDASECPPTFQTDPEMVQGIIAGGQTALWRAAEGAEDDPAAGARAMDSRGVAARDTVVGIAASGRTPFVWGALEEAKKRRAATILLTLNPHLKIPREHRPDVVVAPDIGPEVLTGSTRLKSGTATKLILNMFTTLAMVRMGKVLSNLMVDVKPTNVKLRDRAVRIVQTLTNVDENRAKTALITSGWIIKDAVGTLTRRRPRGSRKI